MVAPGDFGHMDTRMMTAVLSLEMMSRGKDATGIATVDQKGRWKVRKQACPADVFLASRQGIGRNAMSALIHTRAATQGKPSNPGNNHPIVHGSIVGIHNGIVFNDDQLFHHYGWTRNAEVDSEAIFAAINHLPLDDALTNIDAGWAIGWFDTDNDPRKLWLARGQNSPLHYALTTLGSVVFASTATAVKEAFEWAGVTGDPNVILAPEGFLAHTEITGGLTILPSFDGTGKDAIGARKYTNNYATGAYTSGYTHAGYGWDNGPSKEPVPFVREMISGNKAKPMIGDRRRYLNGDGVTATWVTEVCTRIYPTTLWQQLIGSQPAIGPQRADDIPLSTSVDGGTLVEHNSWQERLEEVEAARRDRPVVVPFDQEIEVDETAFGFARIGDLIAVDKENFGGGEGALVGIVVDEDPISGQLVVEWRTGRIDWNADYRVMIPAQKGA